MIDPQRWNMYAYTRNNPLTYVDPDGQDAIAVNFSHLAVGTGHAAIVSVHDDGSAMFGGFGPLGGGKPVAAGEIDRFSLATKLVFGNDGIPTKESFQALTRELASREGQPADSISFAYFKTSEADTIALDNYINGYKPGEYVVGFNDCRTFCMAGLHAAHVATPITNYVQSQIQQSFFNNFPPNLLILNLMVDSAASYDNKTGERKIRKKGDKPEVRSRICFQGDAGCPAK